MHLTLQSQIGAEGLEIGDNNLNDFGSHAADSQFPNQAFDDFGEGARDDEIPIPPQKPNSPKKKKAAATGGAKRKHGLWDENIDLADEQLKGMRDGYEERMTREKKEAQNKARRFEATDLVQSMMNGTETNIPFSCDGVLISFSQAPLLGGESLPGDLGDIFLDSHRWIAPSPMVERPKRHSPT